MTEKFSRYDVVVECLDTQEEMAAYLEAVIDEANGDAAFIAKALGDIARAEGMTTNRTEIRSFPRKFVQGAVRGKKSRIRNNIKSD